MKIQPAVNSEHFDCLSNGDIGLVVCSDTDPDLAITNPQDLWFYLELPSIANLYNPLYISVVAVAAAKYTSIRIECMKGHICTIRVYDSGKVETDLPDFFAMIFGGK